MTTFTLTMGTSPSGPVIEGQPAPPPLPAPSTLQFDLDATPSVISDAGDCLIVCVARPAAQGVNARTLALTPAQVAMLDGYVAQTGATDVPMVALNQVVNLIRGLVQSGQTDYQVAIQAAIAAEIANIEGA